MSSIFIHFTCYNNYLFLRTLLSIFHISLKLYREINYNKMQEYRRCFRTERFNKHSEIVLAGIEYAWLTTRAVGRLELYCLNQGAYI
jgi:hypothetical protein